MSPTLFDDVMHEVYVHPWRVLARLGLVAILSVALPVLILLLAFFDSWLTSLLL